MQTYLISCDELPERRDAALAHLRERGITPRGLPGIHGASWTLDTTVEYEAGKRISAGHVSLLLNHWIAWNYAAGLSPEMALFLEDDAVLPPDWGVRFDDVAARLDRDFPDWEFCFVGLAESPPGCWHKVGERIGGPDSPLCRMSDPFGTHAYLVRPSGLPKLIKHFPGGGARRNADQQLYRNVLAPGHVKWCAVLPTIVTQRTFDYTGSGKTEWAPSCVDAAPAASPSPKTGWDAQCERDAAAFNAPRVAIGTPAASPYERTLALVDPLPCIYRGESRDDHGHVAGERRTVPVYDCTRLGTVCHTREYPRVTAAVEYEPGPVVAASCRDCTIRLEMPSGARGRLPLPDGHFNPSIMMWNGRLLLATRDSWGHSRVALWWLDNARPDWDGEWTATPIGSYAADHPAAPRLEDPRLFVARGPDGEYAPHAAFNLPDGYPPKRVRVGYVRFAPDLSGIASVRVMESPAFCAYEKNWSPFWDDAADKIRWIYGMKPAHTVLRNDSELSLRWSFTTPNPLPWTGGVMRGGAAPIPMPGGREYWVFFHGCLKRIRGSVYTTGCYVMDARPPYRVLRQTRTPLVWPDLPAPGESVVKRYVVWPGGAVYHGGSFFVVHGIDDTYCRMVRLPFDSVDAAMSDVPETDAAASIRATPLARGVPRGEIPEIP